MAKKIIKPGSPKVKKALRGAAIVADSLFVKKSSESVKKASQRAQRFSAS